MSNAESRYIHMLGEHILEILPETPDRREKVLSYIRARLSGAQADHFEDHAGVVTGWIKKSIQRHRRAA